MAEEITAAFFARDVDAVARELIGVQFTFRGAGGMIVETESYDASDPASHSFGNRMTARNAAMFAPPAHAYVYRAYGIHWCLNFTCRPGGAVLIRALEPRRGLDQMRSRRGTAPLHKLCSGPGNVCAALSITGTENGASLLAPPFQLKPHGGAVTISTGVRIGITKATEAERRYGLAGSPSLSRRFETAE